MTQDACLKAFWRKPALRTFLKQHHITEAKLATWHEDETKRVFLQRLFYDLLSAPENKGHAVILAMARSLAEMTHFPDLEHWEDSNEKLAAAQEAVARVKAKVTSLTQKVEDERETQARRKRAQERQERTRSTQETLVRLAERLTALVPKQGTPGGGYEFEKWFYDLTNYFELSSRPPFKTGGRQMDGSLNLDGTDYLIETKFTSGKTGACDIDVFMAKIRQKADNTMGLFISMSGFSKPAMDSASCDRTPMLLMDYSHMVNLILSGAMSLQDVISRIRRHASQTGDAYLACDKFSG